MGASGGERTEMGARARTHRVARTHRGGGGGGGGGYSQGGGGSTQYKSTPTSVN